MNNKDINQIEFWSKFYKYYNLAKDQYKQSIKENNVKIEIIDNETGKIADYRQIIKEDWCSDLLGRGWAKFAVTEDFEIILLDACGNCAYAPKERFSVKITI